MADGYRSTHFQEPCSSTPGPTCPSTLASTSVSPDMFPGLSVGFEQVYIVLRQRCFSSSCYVTPASPSCGTAMQARNFAFSYSCMRDDSHQSCPTTIYTHTAPDWSSVQTTGSVSSRMVPLDDRAHQQFT